MVKEAKKKKKSAKAKALPGKAPADDSKATKNLEECDEFTPLITSKTSPQESRIKTALDDFLASLVFARRNLTVKIAEDEANRSKHFLTSLFLELSWNQSVQISGKVYRIYSTFRDECQRVYISAHQRLHVGEDSYDPLQLARSLMSMVSAPVSQLQR